MRFPALLLFALVTAMAIAQPGAQLRVHPTTGAIIGPVDTETFKSGNSISSGGDVTSNTATSVDTEIALFNSTTGKSIKRGPAKLSAAGVLSGVSTISDAPITTDPDFAIVVVPDTQLLLEEGGFASPSTVPPILTSWFNWMVTNKTVENIKAVVGVGDITETGDTQRFERAVAMYNIAKTAEIPVVPVLGNHDYNGTLPSTRNTTNYNAAFGPSYFTGQSYYGGTSYPNGTNDNFYITFTNGGQTYLVLAMEFFPRAGAVSWAQGIIAANPNAYIIITTHAWLKNTGTRVLDADSAGPDAYSLPSGDYNGEELYNALVKPYSNVRMVVNGHFIFGPLAARNTDISSTTGAITHQLFVDYQFEALEDQYLLILRFKPSQGIIQGEYYSPYLSQADPAYPAFTLPYQPAKIENSSRTVTDAFVGRDLVVKNSLTVGAGSLPNFTRIDASGNLIVGTDSTTGLSGGGQILAGKGILAGTTPTTLTDSAGKILSAALNTVAIAQGGTGATSAANARTALGVGTGDTPTFAGAILSGTNGSSGLLQITNTTREHIRLNNRFSFIGSSNFHLTNNAGFDNTNFRYIADGVAGKLLLGDDGSFSFSYAASGTAGNVATFGSSVFSVAGATGNTTVAGTITAGSSATQVTDSAGLVRMAALPNPFTSLVINGTSSSAGLLSITNSTREHIRLNDRFSLIGLSNFYTTNNARYDGTDFRYTNTGEASRLMLGAGTLAFSYVASGTAGNVASFGANAFSVDGATGNTVLTGTLTAGSGSTQVTTAAGLVRDAAIESTIARDSEVAAKIDDTAYDATTWNGVTDRAPSMNAVRDKIEAMVAGGGLGTADIDTSAELRSIVTDESGTGALIFAAGNIGAATATTASADDNTTLVATTAYVQTELAAVASDSVTLTNKTIALGSNTITGTSAELRTALSDESGTGAALFAGGNIAAGTATTPSADDNDTSIATTAYVQTELTAYAADTVTFTNKTFDAAGTGNVFKAKGYIYLTHPHLADGTGATINTTATAITYGHASFSNSADEAGNYVEYYIQVPEDIDTSVALRARLKVLLGNTDTGTHRYVLSSVSVADSAVPPSSTLANAINVDFAGDGSGANGDIETSAWTTLTSWAGALTAGQTWRIRLARDGNATEDASTVNSTELGLVIEYGITQ